MDKCRVCGKLFQGIGLACPDCVEAMRMRIGITDVSEETKDMKSVKVPKKSLEEELKHEDSILPQMEAFKYAMAHLNGDFVKKDCGKLQWSLMPFEELKDVVKVLMHGAEKYSPDNWKKCDDVTRYKDALMRHVIAYVSGNRIDPEFGLSHLAHAVCNCLFLMWFDNHRDAPCELKEEKRND